MESLKIVYKGGEGELVEKKSRFIATVEPVDSEEQALAFIERMRKKYWDASHNCYAYIIGEKNELQRCSDDGEPSQTAGRPMLDVLLGEEIHNTCIVVTRYFGGTLLGTGGLVRAYSGAAKEGLANAAIVTKILARELELTSDYTDIGKIQYILAQKGTIALDTQYSDRVVVRVLAPVGDAKKLEADLIEGTNGRIGIELLRQVYYGMVQGKAVLFE